MLSLPSLDSKWVETHYMALTTTALKDPKCFFSKENSVWDWEFTQGNLNLILKIWSISFNWYLIVLRIHIFSANIGIL